MSASESDFRADDGYALHVYRWAPASGTATRGAIHVVHGMAEHAARYARLGEALSARGWVVTAHDQRGHGRTAARDEDLGYFADAGGWKRVVSDAAQLVSHARAENPGLPVVLFGHSMGSFVAQNVLWERPDLADAAVLSGSNGTPGLLAQAGRVVARLERARLGARGKSALLTNLSFGAYNKPFAPARTAYDWLSSDPDEVDKYIADPRCGFACTTNLWVDLLDALPTLSRADRVTRIARDLPLYLFAGERDPVGELGAGMRRLADAYRAGGVRDVTLKLYPEGRHEMLNERNRETVMGDLADWLEAHAHVRHRTA